MKRYEIKNSKKPVSTKTPSELRQEIDASIQYITQTVIKDPKKASKVFEGWLNQTQAVEKKKRAA